MKTCVCVSILRPQVCKRTIRLFQPSPQRQVRNRHPGYQTKTITAKMSCGQSAHHLSPTEGCLKTIRLSPDTLSQPVLRTTPRLRDTLASPRLRSNCIIPPRRPDGRPLRLLLRPEHTNIPLGILEFLQLARGRPTLSLLFRLLRLLLYTLHPQAHLLLRRGRLFLLESRQKVSSDNLRESLVPLLP